MLRDSRALFDGGAVGLGGVVRRLFGDVRSTRVRA